MSNSKSILDMMDWEFPYKCKSKGISLTPKEYDDLTDELIRCLNEINSVMADDTELSFID